MRLDKAGFLRDVQLATKGTEGAADGLIKAMAEAQQAIQRTGQAGRESAGALARMGEAGGAAGAAGAKLAGILDTVAPGLGSAARLANDLGDAMEVASSAGAALGPMALAVGGAVAALGAAFTAVEGQIRREAEAAAFAREQHAALVPTLRALEDQTIQLALATGRLTEAQAQQAQSSLAAQRSVRDFATAQAEARAEIASSTESAQRWIDLTTTILPRAINPAAQVADAIFGWSEAIEEGDRRLRVLDGTVQQEAASQKALRAAVDQTAAAERERADATGAATRATVAAAEVARDSAADRAAYLRALAEEADALRILARLSAPADRGGSARIDAERADQLERAADAADVLARTRGEDVAASKLLAAQTQIEADAYAQQMALREELVARLSAAQEQAHQEQLARLARERAAIVQGVSDTLSAISTLAGVAAEKQSEANAEAALRLWRLQKGAAIGAVVINTAEAVTKALATLGPIAGAVAAGGIIATGTAQAAVIAAQEPPRYHRGGLVEPGRPREVPALLEAGEGVLTRRGVQAAGGERGLAALNRGEGGSAEREVVAVDARSPLLRGGLRDALRVGDLRRATRAGTLPGRRS
jgi:hypothetical protein